MLDKTPTKRKRDQDGPPPTPKLMPDRRVRMMCFIHGHMYPWIGGVGHDCPWDGMHPSICWKCPLSVEHMCASCATNVEFPISIRKRNKNQPLFISRNSFYFLLRVFSAKKIFTGNIRILILLFLQDKCGRQKDRGGKRCHQAMPPVDGSCRKRIRFSYS